MVRSPPASILSIYPFFSLFFLFSIYPSIFLSIHPSICLSNYLASYVAIYLPFLQGASASISVQKVFESKRAPEIASSQSNRLAGKEFVKYCFSQALASSASTLLSALCLFCTFPRVRCFFLKVFSNQELLFRAPR